MQRYPRRDRIEARIVLAELTDLDVEETPPVELLAKVQDWQGQIGEE